MKTITITFEEINTETCMLETKTLTLNNTSTDLIKGINVLANCIKDCDEEPIMMP